VVARDDDEQMVRYLKELKENPDILQRLKEGAVKTAKNWSDWKLSSGNFSETLTEKIKQAGTYREDIESRKIKLKNDYEIRNAARTSQQFADRESHKSGNIIENDNFIQLYCWQEDEGLQPDHVHLFPYICGKLTTVYCKIALSGFPFWIRIDPSVRIGILSIDSLEIINERTGKTVLSCSTPEEFSQLYVTGTLIPIKGKRRNLYLSYGDDPQIILPELTNAKAGNFLLVSMSLEEFGIAQFLQDNWVAGSRIISKICGQNESFYKPRLVRFAHRMKSILRRGVMGK